MTDFLAKSGIFFDEVEKVRILDPTVAKHGEDLKDNSKIYVARIEEFQKLSQNLLSNVEKLGNEVEKQNMKAIGARNLLQSMTKQQETQQQQLQALVIEKSTELERLKVQLSSLQRIEMEQNEIITRLTQN